MLSAQDQARAILELRRRRGDYVPPAEAPAAQVRDWVDADAIAWGRKHFYIPELKGPIALYPAQTAPLREALRRDAEGLFVYSTVVWSAIKKSAKSSIAAMVGLWMAWQKPWSSIKVIANDLKQADSRVAFYMRRAIELNPLWAAMLERKEIRFRGYSILLPNHSVIEALPIDPKGEAGGSDDMLIYSEMWGWKSQAARQMWTETTLSPLKYGHSLRWCETYAGYEGESPVLERLYEQGVKLGAVLDAEREMYANAAARLFVLWMTRPSLPWQTPRYYAQEESSLTPEEFDRIHGNVWSRSLNAFVPLEWWERCRGRPPRLERDEPVIVVLDAAVSGDCFGLMMLSGHSHPRVDVAVRYARAWKPPKGGKLAFQGQIGEDGTPEAGSPEGEVRRLLREYNVIEVVYDPYQLEDMAGRLRQELIANLYAFGQTTPRLVADKGLFDLIRGRRVAHSGEKDLGEHIQNANRKSDGESKLRLVKRAEHMKIDLAVCLSMGAARVRFWGL